MVHVIGKYGIYKDALGKDAIGEDAIGKHDLTIRMAFSRSCHDGQRQSSRKSNSPPEERIGVRSQRSNDHR